MKKSIIQRIDLAEGVDTSNLFGHFDNHLRIIERGFDVNLFARGEEVVIEGEAAAVRQAGKVIGDLSDLVREGVRLTPEDVEHAVRNSAQGTLESEPTVKELAAEAIVVANKKKILPKSPAQKEYVESMRRHDIVVAIGPAGTGKCIAGSSLVFTAGGLRRIESLVPESSPGRYIQVDLIISGLDGSERATHCYSGGRSSTKKICTRFGFEIEVTPEHPLLQLTPGGNVLWRRSDQLKPGDYVAIQRGQNLFGSDTAIRFEYRRNGRHDHAKQISIDRLDEEFARFMGILTGDGCLSFKNRVIVSSADEEVLSCVYRVAARLGLHLFRNGSNRPYDRIIASSALYQLLLHLGMSGGLAAGKRAPHSILRAPREIVAAFLRGLFDTDGTVSRRDGYPSLSSVSKQLIDGVQLLLLNFGILANKRRKRTLYRGERRLSYQLEMTGADADCFYEEIGFGPAGKQELRRAKEHNTNVDVIPYLNELVQSAVSGVTLSRAIHKRLDDYESGRRNPSYDKLGQILATLEENGAESYAGARLEEFNERHLFWAEIIGIEDGEAEVYDLTVPGSHSFCANGFVNHNTYLGMAMGVSAFLAREVSRIILARPAVEAGEKLGFLPGDIAAKVNPYLRPLYDALYDMMEFERANRLMERGDIEIAPLAYMRGRAQPYFSRVLTPSGLRPIGSLAVGDLVIGSDGRPTPVIGVYPQGPKQIFRVRTQDGASTLCCAEHLWAVSTRDDRRRGKLPRVLETQQMLGWLRQAHYRRFELPLISRPVEFEPRHVPMDPYALGLLLGDGCLTGSTTPTFATADPELTLALEGGLEGIEVRARGGVDYVLRHTAGGRGGVIVANPVTATLRDLGLAGSRSATKFVPESYLYNSSDVRLALLQGLLDTDGGPVTQLGRSCRIQYCTTSPRLRDDVVFLVRSLGGVAYRRTRVAAGRPPGLARGRPVYHRFDAYVLDIRLPTGITPFRLSRKIEAYRGHGGGRPMRFIDGIESAGEEETVCIQVAASDSLYVTDDFLVTHNTLNDSFIILDEAQNTTSEQMKMFLTRLGYHSKIVVTGDITQVDLPTERISGLIEIQAILDKVPGIRFAYFTEKDVVRHRLVQDIVKAYERYEEKSGKRRR